MMRLAKMLRQEGAKIPTGLTLYTADSISADGTTFAGQCFDAQGNLGNWIAHITK